VRIALGGPYPQPGIRVGGGELANARFHASLARRGLRVLALPKPQRQAPTFAAGLRHAFACLRYYATCAVIARRRRCRLLQYRAFYDNLMPFEVLLALSCRLLRVPLVYVVSGGAFVATHVRRGRLYRAMVGLVLKRAAVVLTEGRRDQAWIAANHPEAACLHHVPNFVAQHDTARATAIASPPPGGALRILHASRLVPDKGVERSLALVATLRHLGLPVELHICGTGEPGYLASLHRMADDHPDTRFHGQLSQTELLRLMGDCHLFSFPSANPMEGQSNALTEAMSQGLVPVFTEAGFSDDVVGGLGIRFSRNVDETAAAIRQLWEAGLATRQSEVLRMARRRFSEPAVLRTLVTAYRCGLTRRALL